MSSFPNKSLAGFQGVAEGEKILAVLKETRHYASVNRPILIRGERGSGKELVARYIHYHSDRCKKPFFAINCGGTSEELLSSEIFGHEKGAFTGAHQLKEGRLEQADGGTLFLDEIGNMSIAFQKMILRVIEYQEFERLGGSEKIKVNVRFVSATNAPLEEMIQKNLFRADFYDRISFASITLPALRERRDEIPFFITHFIQSLHLEMPNLETKKFKHETLECLSDYHWPGNIRELKNIVERLYLGPSQKWITPEDLPNEILGEKFAGNSFDEKIEHYKRKILIEALNKSGGLQKKAAEGLAMSYDSFRHYYKKYSLNSNPS